MKAVATHSRSSKGHHRCKYCGEERPFNPNGQTPKERGFDGAKCYVCYKKHNAEYQATKKSHAQAGTHCTKFHSSTNGMVPT